MNHQERKLDWVSRHDERSRLYAIRPTLEGLDLTKRRVMWKEGTVLDQGAEGACVGFSWVNELLSEPMPPVKQPEASLGNAVAYSYYKEAQKIDEWAGESYEGTSVLAGAKVIQRQGFISQYRWCFGINDVRDAVIAEGPVVVGVPWYSGMYRTDRSGIVVVDGEKVGGHAILITGYDPSMVIKGKPEEVFRWRNSWGSGYGINGSGYILASDLERLLTEAGEACVPIGRSVPVIKIGSSSQPKIGFFTFLCQLFCK